jgi:outer membrane protein assembly factor BamB
MVWTERLGGPVTSSPILIDGKILSINNEGTVSIFAAEPQFKLLGKNSMGEAVSATPAVAGQRLYVRGESHLFCIGKPHG